jgi:hypothetical protein
MAADVRLTEREAAVETARAATPTAQLDPALHAMLSYANGDPDMIAEQIIHTGRTQDPRIWSELQQTLGNGMMLKIRGAIAQRAHPEGAHEQAHPPQPVPQVAAAAEQVERDVLGVRITAPAGVRGGALEEVARIVQAEVGNNEYAQHHFETSKVTIVIVPAHVAMTALPEFAHLQGQKTFDGRDWSTVRGSGGTPSPGGRFSIAVAEEGLERVPDMKLAYPATYSIAMHELAHVLESKGMTRTQQGRVKQLYDAHIKRDPHDANDTFTDTYGSENEQEYFAQATNAFFGRNVMGKNHSGRAWLQHNDPQMYAFLVDLYDHHRNQEGDVVA